MYLYLNLMGAAAGLKAIEPVLIEAVCLQNNPNFVSHSRYKSIHVLSNWLCHRSAEARRQLYSLYSV